MTGNNHNRRIPCLSTLHRGAVNCTTADVGIATTRPLFIAAGTSVAGRTRQPANRANIRCPEIWCSDMGKSHNRNKQVEDDQKRGDVS